jgi:hypothetical protein
MTKVSLCQAIIGLVIDVKRNLGVIPSKGVEHRYPVLQDVTMSLIGIPASASASVAEMMHIDLVSSYTHC